MKQTFSILVLVLTMVSLNASAGIFGGSGEQTNQQTNRQNVDQNQRQRQDQSQTARGGTGGSGGNASSDASSDANAEQDQTATSQNYYRSEYKASKYKDYVAPAYAPNLTSHDCFGSKSAGIVLPGLGSLSGGSTDIDPGCDTRMDSAHLEGLSRLAPTQEHKIMLFDASIQVLCNKPEMAEVLAVCPSAVYNPSANDVVVTWD